MGKKSVIYSNFTLLIWFSLDMIGVYLEDSYIVSRSWKEDGLFFLIYLICFLVFLFKESVGKYTLSL